MNTSKENQESRIREEGEEFQNPAEMDCNSLSPPQALTIKSRYCTNLEESG